MEERRGYQLEDGGGGRLGEEGGSERKEGTSWGVRGGEERGEKKWVIRMRKRESNQSWKDLENVVS